MNICFLVSQHCLAVPRPIIGQQQGFMRNDRISHDESELELLSAEILRQQAIYEHIYSLIMTGKLPVPPLMRMWSPQVCKNFSWNG